MAGTRSDQGSTNATGADAPARDPARLGRSLRRALFAAAALIAVAPALALAQQAPAITIPATIAVEAPSQSAFSISVGPADKIPRNSFLRLRGLPPMAALSEGHSIAPGAWAVSLTGLANLRLTMPASAAGRSEITLALVSVDGAVLAEARSVLLIGPQQPSSGAPTSATMLRAATPGKAPPPEAEASKPPPAPPRNGVPNMTPEDRERALRLLKRGQEQLEDANLSAARLFFERAADAGLAEAALALGATYETAELQRLNIRDVKGDAKEARRWYERAAQLGAPEARQRLQRLGNN